MWNDALEQAVQLLRDTADLCDRWAEESKSGGWSTHQVDENRATADNLRRQASVFSRAIESTPPTDGEG